MIPFEIAKTLERVPEEQIRNAADHFGPNSVFKKLIDSAEIYRKANMNPIFLSSKSQDFLTVSSEETFRTKLH